jgi:anhydro-N-acetylmuramic acid kinase
MTELYIGLMSGTSMDGVDAVLVNFSEGKPRVMQHACAPLSADLRTEFLALNTSGTDELHRAALAANALARLYAKLVHKLLSGSGARSADVLAIGAHGQTVRHRPQCFDSTGYTIQLNNPALLAELTGIDVVADFRSRDVAAGGQGAPLVPAFHLEMFGRAGKTITVLNIGGISNLSVLDARDPTRTSVVGFDCGPGNALMDHWCHLQTGQNFDAGGQWAACGQVHPQLLEHLASDPFFSQPPPKSTGRDLFNAEWLGHKLSQLPQLRVQDVQATLTELTAMTCCAAIEKYAPDSEVLIVCGGGALNTHLMGRLNSRLPSVQVAASDDYGLAPQQVEATAFAWLARKAISRETANIPAVTGAAGARILGAIYPA